MPNEAILVCYCPGIDKRAVATFQVVAKDHPVPPLYKGKYGIADFLTILHVNVDALPECDEHNYMLNVKRRDDRKCRNM